VSTNGGSTFSDLGGQTSTTLSLSNVALSMNTYEYRAVFTNPVGTATSTAATLTVSGIPTVRTQPQNVTASTGSSVLFTATTRMPMVAGWDSLLPGWFARLHPRYRTPVNSIVFIGLCALAFAAAGMVNVGEQEAFQLIDNAAGIFYGLTYLVLFAVPLVGWRAGRERAPLWLRGLAVAGLATTSLYVVLSVLPIVDVASRLAFAFKIIFLVAGENAIGVALYVRERRRAAAATVAASLVT